MDVFTKHQLRIARDTLKMSNVGALIMGGMSKAEARGLLGVALLSQHENGTYCVELRDKYGDIASGSICQTAQEAHKWAYDHAAKSVELA